MFKNTNWTFTQSFMQVSTGLHKLRKHHLHVFKNTCSKHSRVACNGFRVASGNLFLDKKRKEKITPIFNTGVNVSPLAIYWSRYSVMQCMVLCLLWFLDNSNASYACAENYMLITFISTLEWIQGASFNQFMDTQNPHIHVLINTYSKQLQNLMWEFRSVSSPSNPNFIAIVKYN